MTPPLEPMLARLSRGLPGDGFLYEPKWDGFRCLIFRSGSDVDMRSRNGRPLARYFPEVAGPVRALPQERFVLDGELVVETPEGFDFSALLSRLHPAASRVERLSKEVPSSFVTFDLPALGERDLRAVPFEERRRMLESMWRDVGPPLHLTPLTPDRSVAEGWLQRFGGGGVDGVVAKHRALPYRSGVRAMIKVKRERTVECVVGGFRLLIDRPLPSSLLLGLYADDGSLQHVGLASGFAESMREEILRELDPFVTSIEGHPWEAGFLLGGSPMGRLGGAAARWVPEMGQDWVPVRPELVCEVAYDHLDRDRFRHPAHFRRWRPDRDPLSCGFDQLASEAVSLAELVGTR